MKRSLVFVCILSVISLACGQSQSERPATVPVEERIANVTSALVPIVIIEGEEPAPAAIEERMRQLVVPGVSIAVINDGKVEWARGFGFADLESKRPVTPDTLFQAASISKPVAALAALALVDQGVLELDAPINEKLATWEVPDNEFTALAPVTLRGLVTHTAGLTVHGFPGYGPDETVPLTVSVLDGEGNTDPVRVDQKPGTEWRYSGGGYTVMQQLIEDVAGMPFAEVMATIVLGPLGMDHSTYRQPLPNELYDRAATGYRANGVAIEGRFHTYPEQAAAGLWTTPSDLAQYLVAGQRGLETGYHPVLSAEMVRQMLSPGMGDWGLGPAFTEDHDRFGHGGANEGFRCDMTAFVDGGRGAVIMTNSDSGGRLARELMLAVAKEYGWSGPKPVRKMVADLSHDDLAAIGGIYRGAMGDLTIEAKDGRLVGGVSIVPSMVLEFVPESETKFFNREDGMELTVVRNHDGTVRGVTVAGSDFEKVE